jgi:glucose-1-phosphate thymidylyltransferase
MMQAANFVYALEERTGEVIGSIELAAYRNGWISRAQLEDLVKDQVKSGYGRRVLSSL